MFSSNPKWQAIKGHASKLARLPVRIKTPSSINAEPMDLALHTPKSSSAANPLKVSLKANAIIGEAGKFTIRLSAHKLIGILRKKYGIDVRIARYSEALFIEVLKTDAFEGWFLELVIYACLKQAHTQWKRAIPQDLKAHFIDAGWPDMDLHAAAHSLRFVLVKYEGDFGVKNIETSAYQTMDRFLERADVEAEGD